MKRYEDNNATISAFISGQVDLIAGDATSGLIAAYDLVMLEDNRRYFPPYDAVPVARAADVAVAAGGASPNAVQLAVTLCRTRARARKSPPLAPAAHRRHVHAAHFGHVEPELLAQYELQRAAIGDGGAGYLAVAAHLRQPLARPQRPQLRQREVFREPPRRRQPVDLLGGAAMMEGRPPQPCRKTAAPARAAHRRQKRQTRRLDARASGVCVGTRLTVEPFRDAYASQAIKERVPMSQLPTQHIEAAKNRVEAEAREPLTDAAQRANVRQAAEAQ